MSDDTNTSLLNRLSDSRRDFLKKGALASGGLLLGASGTATAQQDDDDGILGEGWQGLIFIQNFQPNARFAFVSDVINWVPNYPDVRDSAYTDYNTYHIRWQNTGEVVPLFVAEDAPIGDYDEGLGFIPDDQGDSDQPQLYQMNQEYSPLGDNEQLIAVNVNEVSEEDQDDILDDDGWWQDDDVSLGTGNGTSNGNDTFNNTTS
ncbi:twin-arginine translocation signal domain-containing protein [Haloarcula onubensis]|uniref:Twin-arginine translocation signal domain-containing protein n=1 Tax=Haloarcula onubensis TaxID=2950539 RepID=A0ABU2FTD8_9EURY|nr:twin-arginine translocation signal domain-containing protein [Halomicroarcula sp. S3CR25-11]MDS0283511.1 twin-arginine translocation signal domain-containing protein [Halomicroarcula sp. S3CR25-11]